MKHYEIGIDLGTSSVIIATKEQGVIFRQPTVGAVDTRGNTVIAVGDKALAGVPRENRDRVRADILKQALILLV